MQAWYTPFNTHMKKPWILGTAFAGILLIGAACQQQIATNTNTTTNTAVNSSVSGSNVNRASATNSTSQTSVSWQFSGSEWESSGTPPACPAQPMMQMPVDIDTVRSVLYPGQTRGGNYKPHGGFRFDSSAAAVRVTAPMDASVVNASRYIEQGEVQYLFTFIAPCGIMYRFDHLRVLSPAMQAIADTLPAAQADDSRTTRIDPPVAVQAGDTIATAVGFANTSNIAVDFGAYDLRNQNTASQSAAFQSAHANDKEMAWYGLCIFDMLSKADREALEALPAADQASGKASDYCQ